jgi:hypothetical protein
VATSVISLPSGFGSWVFLWCLKDSSSPDYLMVSRQGQIQTRTLLTARRLVEAFDRMTDAYSTDLTRCSKRHRMIKNSPNSTKEGDGFHLMLNLLFQT